jgi:hypothetical protein
MSLEETLPSVEEEPTLVDDSLDYDIGEECLAGTCPSEPLMWVRGEYLLWWTKGMDTPPLATTSPAGTLQDDAGVLGSLNTRVLFGGGDLLDDVRSGGRVTLGMWLDPCFTTGLELSYLGLGEESAEFHGSNDDFNILARPFFNVVTGAEDARLIVFPDLVEGSLAIDASSEFQSAEALLRRRAAPTCWSDVDYLFGYRYAQLEDHVGIAESTESLAEPTVGTTFQLNDRFETQNRFHGGQVGVRLSSQATPCWFVEFVGKLALGNTLSRTTIGGQTIVTVPDDNPATQRSGLLAQGTNIGSYETSEISTITEAGVTLRRQLPYGWSLNVGYSFLFWTDVVRAGSQIDRGVNTSQIPPGTLVGDPRPAFRAVTDDFWAQGLNFGLDFRY